MSVLARELTRRGHRVTFMGFRTWGRGWRPTFASLPSGAGPAAGSLEPYLARLSRLGGPVSLYRLIRDLAAFADTICRDLPARWSGSSRMRW
jgi:hypothetical protein